MGEITRQLFAGAMGAITRQFVVSRMLYILRHIMPLVAHSFPCLIWFFRVSSAIQGEKIRGISGRNMLKGRGIREGLGAGRKPWLARAFSRCIHFPVLWLSWIFYWVKINACSWWWGEFQKSNLIINLWSQNFPLLFFVLTLRQTEKLVNHRCLGVHWKQPVILKVLLSKNKLPCDCLEILFKRIW